jgi:hypothetical protein
MKLTLIPAGEFMMGLEDTQEFLSAFPNEKLEYFAGDLPSHRVRITRPFYLGTHEVTLGQLQEFVRSANYKLECEKAGKVCWGYSAKGRLIESTIFRPWNTVAWEPLPENPAVYVSRNGVATGMMKTITRNRQRTIRMGRTMARAASLEADRLKTRRSSCVRQLGPMACQQSPTTVGDFESFAQSNNDIGIE